jgi:hypothetical protein
LFWYDRVPQEAGLNPRAKLLGHRNVFATQIYVNFEQALFREANDEYPVEVAETVEEAIKLIAVGYEYVSTMGDKQIYRKRK